jgi:hypothetical protein
MTAKDMQAAVDRIKADPDFARRAYEDPEAVLPSEYDLGPAQWKALHQALVADIDDSDEDVSGFQLPNWGTAMEFPHLDVLVSPSDSTNRYAHKHIAGVKYED